MPRTSLVALLLLTATALQAKSPQAPIRTPGQQKDGAVLLPNQWLLRPVGKHLTVGDFPVNIALHPSGLWAAVLHSGNGPHEIVTLDLTKDIVVSRTELFESFYGLAFSKDGHRLICSGSSGEVLHSFHFEHGSLSDHQWIPLRDPDLRGVPAGLALTSDGAHAYVANLWGHTISYVRLDKPYETPAELPLGGASGPEAAPASAPSAPGVDPSVTKRAEALLEAATSAEPFPYACVLDETKHRLYVSLWAQAAVAVIDTESFKVTGRWAVEEHPNEMQLSRDGKHLFVANANRNSVSVLDTTDGHIVETLVAELAPGAEPGNTPNSLALSPDEKQLYVANANINTVAVFDVSELGHSLSLGFIPVGWYPTSVRVTPNGKRLLVANGKGLISNANRNGPKPGVHEVPTTEEYIGSLMRGVVSLVKLPDAENLTRQMAEWTHQAFSCMPPNKIDEAALAGNPIPRKIGDPSPIRYVIYIVKENRTFDQILGDLGKGNADPSLCIFDESITPNHHALARDFVLLDNFYVDGEVSADGHEWTCGAYASDFVEKTWPLGYGHSKKFPYPSEGHFPIARPAGGYLWDRAAQAKITYRSYGEFTANGGKPGTPATTREPALKGHFDPEFRTFDIDYPDAKRADRFISELQRFEAAGDMPRLQILRLPNDHTAGTSANKPTPTAFLADNDLAFGRVIEAVSKSRFWPQTAVFVVEDDAQNGSDHVDAHRTIAFAISPYIKRGAVDSTLYSTSSMLRTIELILGLRPMSQFDAAAMPMFAAFQAAPDLTPYAAKPIAADLARLNGPGAWGAQEALAMDFSKEDAADDLRLNEMIWRSVRGADSPMPPPRRAAFVYTPKAKSEDRD